MNAQRDHRPDPLDDLLRQACWPQLSPEALKRVESRLEQARDPGPIGLRRAPSWRGRLVRAGLAFAAAIVLAATLWLWVGPAPETPSIAVGPAAGKTESRTDSDEQIVLPPPAPMPGRAPREWELAYFEITSSVREPGAAGAPSSTRPTGTPSERVEAGLARLERGEASWRVAQELRDLPPRTIEALLIRRIVESGDQSSAVALLSHFLTPAGLAELALAGDAYDAAADEWRLRPAVVVAVARLANPDALAGALIAGEFDGRARVLLAALTRRSDVHALLEAAVAMDGAPELDDPAVMSLARDGAIAGLLEALADPRRERREAAQKLLSLSEDPRVAAALVASLNDARLRRSAMRALMQSGSPDAQRFMRQAHRDGRLAALIRSIRAEDEAAASDGEQVEA